MDTEHEAFVYAVALSHDDEILAVGRVDCVVAIHDLTKNGVEVAVIAGTNHSVSPDSKFSKISPRCSEASALHAIKKPPRRLVTAQVAVIAMEGLINGLAFAPGARSLAVAADQNTVDVWDLTDPTEPVETLVETRHAPTADVAFSRRAGREPKGVPSSSSPDDPRGTPRRRRDASSSDDPRGTPRRRVLGRDRAVGTRAGEEG